MARSKTAARSAAAKKASKTRKRRVAAKKALATRKRRAAAKKALITRKRLGAAKKAVATRKRSKPAGKVATLPQGVPEIDQRIAIIRSNLRELTEQAAGSSGGSTEELMAERIAAQEALLEALSKRREKLLRGS
jgi:hypothetical protein